VDDTAKLKPSHPLNSAGPSVVQILPQEPSANSQGSSVINTRPKSRASEEPTSYTTSSEFRKEGSDWFAVFNPNAKKTFDINLVHSFAHSR